MFPIQKILLAITFLYYLLDSFYPVSNKDVADMRILPQLMGGILCVFCLIVSLKKEIRCYKNCIFSIFYLQLIYCALYIPYTAPSNTLLSNILFYLKSFSAIPFMFTIFYIATHYKKGTNYILAIYFIQATYALFRLIYDKQLSDASSTFDSNSGFILVCCIPMALIIPKKLRLYVYTILVLACIASGQRSAAVAALLTLPIGFKCVKQYIKPSDIFIMIILGALVIYPIAENAITNLLLRHQYDIESGSMGSGRSIFWKIVWDDFWNNDMNIFIGNGINSVPVILKKEFGMAIGAHNGWLDFLYSFGIIGVSIYGLSIFNILRMNKSIGIQLPEYKNILLTIFLVFLIKCTTSHGYFDMTVMPMTMCIAVVLSHFYSSKYESDSIY